MNDQLRACLKLKHKQMSLGPEDTVSTCFKTSECAITRSQDLGLRTWVRKCVVAKTAGKIFIRCTQARKVIGKAKQEATYLDLREVSMPCDPSTYEDRQQTNIGKADARASVREAQQAATSAGIKRGQYDLRTPCCFVLLAEDYEKTLFPALSSSLLVPGRDCGTVCVDWVYWF